MRNALIRSREGSALQRSIMSSPYRNVAKSYHPIYHKLGYPVVQNGGADEVHKVHAAQIESFRQSAECIWCYCTNCSTEGNIPRERFGSDRLDILFKVISFHMHESRAVR